ncbi:hypothetical protein C8A00DRAFT_40557 [Chaetomidium leptoderma]|uniref:N-acetyltransferase domain-containing protein n=1 Tax=Chaetomidium leptoderma TaxID=669021 RepID=A0AAN7A0M9_9PEZI|nr:hypothetical protein C8A00DRAFT_40557 [Chaetomidium leptoderma]
MPPPHELRAWTRQSKDQDNLIYTISTDPSLIQLDALDAAFRSDMLYWAKPLSPAQLKLCVEQSLCLGLYVVQQHDTPPPPLPPSQSQEAAEKMSQGDRGGKNEMIGLARLVTDYTTFGYLTDVYVLPAHQGRGLGRWLMACLDEVLGSWPDLRRCLLFTRGEAAVRMYGETLGARDVRRVGGILLWEAAGARLRVEIIRGSD